MKMGVKRLSAVTFDDIYIPLDTSSPFLIRNLGDPFKSDKSVILLPPSLLQDASQLREQLLMTWQGSDHPHEFNIHYDDVVYRAALIPLRIKNGETGEISSWCLRRLGEAPRDLDEMGLPKSVTQKLRWLGRQRGLVLISGSFGSGKTTTASSCLHAWVQENSDVGVTLEDPPEVPLNFINETGAIYQVEIPEHDFAKGVRAARRWGPRYVLLGDIQTPDAAKELLRISLSGSMVVSAIHASDPVRAIINLISFAADSMSEALARDMVAEALQAVLHQDRRGERILAKLATISGSDDFSRRNLIRKGRFDLLYEAFNLKK